STNQSPSSTKSGGCYCNRCRILFSSTGSTTWTNLKVFGLQHEPAHLPSKNRLPTCKATFSIEALMAMNQNKPAVEPQTQAFLDSLAGAPPLHTLSYSEAHDVLTDLQSNPVQILDAEITDVQWPVGPTGSTRI